MGNFSDFLNNKRHKGQDDISSKNNSEKKTYTNEDLESMINKYSSFSQDKLMSEFIKLTLEKKRKGELNESELEGLKQTISPMLNNEQKIALNQILEMVKNVK